MSERYRTNDYFDEQEREADQRRHEHWAEELIAEAQLQGMGEIVEDEDDDSDPYVA